MLSKRNNSLSFMVRISKPIVQNLKGASQLSELIIYLGILDPLSILISNLAVSNVNAIYSLKYELHN